MSESWNKESSEAKILGKMKRRQFLYLSAVGMAGIAAGCTTAAPTPTTAPSNSAGASPAAGTGAAATAAPGVTQAAGTPKQGGVLNFIVSADPPSFDGHREGVFQVVHHTAPFYNTLVKYKPDGYPEVIGDLAESWDISPDGLTYTFKIRQGVKFHDGSDLTSKDIEVSWNRIVFPPEGVISAREADFSVIESITATDPNTVVFKLKNPSPGLLAKLASPFAYIYKAERLESDPRWPEKNILGTGPFKYQEYVPGSHMAGTRNEDYWDTGKPYLDGFRALIISDPAAKVAAVRGDRAAAEFRSFSPTDRDDLKRALGDQITVQEDGFLVVLNATMNNNKPPFDDVRVRRALSLAIDRWQGAEALAKISIAAHVGAVLRPGSAFALPESELVKLTGFGKDGDAAKEEARQLLREAGVPEGFTFKILNLNLKDPYEPLSVFLIDQWTKIGLNPVQEVVEQGPQLAMMRDGNFEVAIDFNNSYTDEPDTLLGKFLSPDRSPVNYAGFSDPTLDDLYDQQTREMDESKRKDLIWEFERRAISEMVYIAPIIWYQRIIPHQSYMKGWYITPSHYVNQDLSTVWIDK